MIKVTFSLPIRKDYIQYESPEFADINSALDFVHDVNAIGAFNVVMEFDSGFRFRVLPFGFGLRSYPLGSA